MARPDRNISIHRCFFEAQAEKIKKAINEISKKDSLSTEDTQAIRELTEVYDFLINPVPENHMHHQADCNNSCTSQEERKSYIPFAQEDAENLAGDQEELIARAFVKTDGFEKSVVFFMSLLEQIWKISGQHKRFRLELFYDAESLNTNYCFFAPTDKSELDDICPESSKHQD